MAIVETSMHFLARDDLYEKEKPFQLKYAAAEGIPKSNFRLQKQDPIKISNLRGREQQLSLEKNGFAVLKLDEKIPYDDFNNPDGIRRYLEAVSDNLKEFLRADKVQVFQYVVSLRRTSCRYPKSTDDTKIRKRDPNFPVAKEGNDYAFNQPSTVAHIGLHPFCPYGCTATAP